MNIHHTVKDRIDWFEFSLSESDKIRVQELDSARNEDNGTEIEQEIGSILGNYNSPLLITTKKELRAECHP